MLKSEKHNKLYRILMNLTGYILLSWGAMISSFYYYPVNRFPVVMGVFWGGFLLLLLVSSPIELFRKKQSVEIKGFRPVMIISAITVTAIVSAIRLIRIYPGYLLPLGTYNNIYYLELAGFLIILIHLILFYRDLTKKIPLSRLRVMNTIVPVIFIILYLLWSLFQTDYRLPERIGNYKAPGTTEEMRMNVSEEQPLFVFNIYGWDVTSIQWLHDNLPEDVRPYWAIQFVSLTRDTEEVRIEAEKALYKCDELNFNAMIQIEHCLSDSDVPTEYLDSLFEKHPSLVGLSVAEFSAANTSFYGMDYSHFGVISSALDVVTARGGYLMWQDMGYEFRHPFSIAGSHKALYEKISSHSDNVILVDKRNGRSKRQLALSSALGFYLTEKISNWGINSEGWIWWEAGLGPVGKSPVGITKAHHMWEAMFSYPESIFGIEWLMAASAGATVYSLEAPFQGFAALWEDKYFLPAWNEVILPISRKIIGDGIIADKEAVLKKTKVAYHPDRVMPSEYYDDDLFKGLYGPEKSSLYEWLPSTGRYFFLPVLPQFAGNEETGLFDEIITSEFYARNFHRNPEEKKKYFDAVYEPVSEGDAWVVNIGENWYLANPEENLQEPAGFNFNLGENGGDMQLEGEISPNGYGIIQSDQWEVSIYLNNFRINSDKDIWSNREDEWDLKVFLDGNIGGFNTNTFDVQKYVRQMAANPSLDTMRESRLSISIPDNRTITPHIDVNRGDYTVKETDDGIDIIITHNGEVNISLKFISP